MVRLSIEYVGNLLDAINKNCASNMYITRVPQGEYAIISGTEGSNNDRTCRNTELLIKGTLRECYSFVQGMTYALGVDTSTVNSEKGNKTGNRGLYNIYSSHPKFSIVAKKVAYDTYFSQHSLRYLVTLVSCDTSGFDYSVVIESYTPSGILCGGSIKLGVKRFNWTPDMTVNQSGEELVKQIDKEIVSFMARREITPDNDKILWITPEVMRKIGWSTKGVMTKDVMLQVVF